MVALPLFLFWSLAIWGLLSRKPVLIYLFFCSMPFGSVAVLPPGLTAGLTFTPAPIVALLIIARTLTNQRGINFVAESALSAQKLGIIFAFWVLAAATTLIMPSLFAGEILIIPVRGTLSAAAPLYPTNQNISQFAYITISIAAVFAFARLLQSPVMRQHALRGMSFGAGLVIITGALDFATQFVPITFLLEPFRTATYALLTDVEVLGGKRVIGLMPEASSYGGLSLGFLTSLYFMRRGVEDPWLRDRYLPPVLAVLVIFTWLSTSSAAMVGLAMLSGFIALEWTLRAVGLNLSLTQRKQVASEFWIAFSALFAVTAVILLKPDLLDPITALIDRMVLQKTSSHSFEERNMWTAVSWQAAIDTFGLGVGLGSTRPSNAFVAVVSSTGFIGAALYYGFIAQSLLRRAPASDQSGQALMSAVRWSFPPLFLIGLLIGTSADFGAFGAFRYGLASAIAFSGFRTSNVAPVGRPSLSKHTT